MTEHRHVQVAMNTVPTATFEMIKPQFLFGFPETVLNRPAPESDLKDLAQAPIVTTRDSIGKKVLHFVRPHILGNEKRTLIADPAFLVCLAPTGRPTNLPDLLAFMRLLEEVSLGILLIENWRVSS